jgi:hypothetical protein
MPHRRNQGDALDARLESTIGRYFLHGFITEPEFQAGVRYGEIVLDYLQSVDAPQPYGDGFGDLSNDACFVRKMAAAQSRQILKDAAKASRTSPTLVISAVDRLTVYGDPPRDEKETRALHIGLRALAHGSNVIPFSRPASKPDRRN